jgi:spermidine/putrescine transport system substrate-binding protein
LIEQNFLAEIDKSRLSNWKNLDPKFLDPPHDPGNKHSVPYFWGTVAVGIRADHVTEPVKGFEVLFDEKYAGRISMLDDRENVVAIAMLHLGHPMNSTEDAHLQDVKELLKRQAPLVQAYTSDTFKDKLIKGEAWVALGWSGDILQARELEKNIRAVVPASGTMIWVDSVAIPRDARNPDLAYEFINYLLEAEVAARNANFVKYASPNAAAREKIKPEILNDPAVYPPKETLDRCQWLLDRGPAIEKIERVWREVRK